MTRLDYAAEGCRTKGFGAAGFAVAYFQRLSELLGQIDDAALGKMVARFEEARRTGARIYIIGNGGKASIAAEFANDLGYETGGNFRAISLADNTALLTAIGNDHGYERTFADQVKNLIERGDVLVALSASGTSANIVAAVDAALAAGASVIALTGRKGGVIGRKATVEINVPSDTDECGLVEDCQMAIMHATVNWFMRCGQWRD